MRITSESVSCPHCGRPAQVSLFRELDAEGTPISHDLAFVCPNGDELTAQQLLQLWANRSRADDAVG